MYNNVVIFLLNLTFQPPLFFCRAYLWLLFCLFSSFFSPFLCECDHHHHRRQQQHYYLSIPPSLPFCDCQWEKEKNRSYSRGYCMQFAAAVVGDGIDIGAQSLHLSLIVAVCSPKSIADDNNKLCLFVCCSLFAHSLSLIYFFFQWSISLSFLLSPFAQVQTHTSFIATFFVAATFHQIDVFLLFSPLPLLILSQFRVVWLPTPIPITSCIWNQYLLL